MNLKLKKILKFLVLGLILGLISLVCIGNISGAKYPKHFEAYVLKYSKEYKVDPYLVFAVIKTESNFFPYAKSRRNAQGLMQLTPDTSDWIAKKLDISEEERLKPENNIRMGCWYLKYLKTIFKEDETALAAYNAGQGNVKKWLKEKEHSDDGLKLKEIPFFETKNYVKKVMRYYSEYKKKYEKKVTIDEDY